MQALEGVPERGGMTIRRQTPLPRAVMAPTNLVVRLLLRSPLHFLLSDDLMLLTYTGRKSGERYTIPIAYEREGDMVTVLTYHAWWKNLLAGAPVVAEIKRRRSHGTAEVIRDDEAAIAPALLVYLREHPRSARGYHVPLDAKGEPEPEAKAVRQAAQFVVLVRIRLGPSAGQMPSDRARRGSMRMSHIPIPASHRDLLESGHNVAVLTTVMPDGQPQITPVWCNLEGNNVLVNTMRGFRKEKNMRANPTVALLAYDPEHPLRCIEVRGSVVAITEEGALEHLDQLTRLYLHRADAAFFGDSVPAELRATYVPVKVRIAPTRVRVEG